MDAEVRAQLVEVTAEAIAQARFEHHRFEDPPDSVLAEAVIDALQIESAGFVDWAGEVSDDPRGDAVFRLGVLSLPPQKETR